MPVKVSSLSLSPSLPTCTHTHSDTHTPSTPFSSDNEKGREICSTRHDRACSFKKIIKISLGARSHKIACLAFCCVFFLSPSSCLSPHLLFPLRPVSWRELDAEFQEQGSGVTVECQGVVWVLLVAVSRPTCPTANLGVTGSIPTATTFLSTLAWFCFVFCLFVF